jgi:hypothetical protein
MKVLIQLAICSTLLLGGAVAQHRGGGGGGSRGSIGGGGHIGGGGFGGSSLSRGGGLVGGGGAFRGGGFGRGYGYGGCCGYGWGGYGFGLGFGLGYYGYGYGYPYYYGGYSDPYSYYPDAYSYPAYQSSYPAYQPSSNVTVVYPQAQAAMSASYDRATPVMREYDQYGQQIRPTGQMGTSGSEGSSPIYLVALKNHNIVAASSYSVSGNTLHYFTLEHAEQQVALDAVDRDLTLRLNHERRVAFSFPAQ